MYLTIRICIVSLCMLFFCHAIAQSTRTNNSSIEIGLNVAGYETLFYGGYWKFIKPLSQNKHHFTMGVSMTTYLDLKGESESGAYLRNDFDMRLIPAVHFGYSFNFNRFQLNLELPVGSSIAVTKGTLVNENIGFKRNYSNKEIFWHYGIGFSPKYRLNNRNQIGLYCFLPLIQDKARSGYIIGIGWTKNFIKRN